jgi:uncharacterized membrane protein YdbT with pleckstrin-like domain
VAPKLSPGEQLVFEGHPSWRALLTFYLKGIGLTVVAAVVAKLVSDSGVVAIVAFVGVALTLVVGFIRRVTTSYTITNRRLHIRRGIVSRTIQETRLDRVQNVNYEQGFLERILQIGNVDFDTAGGSDYNFSFDGVAQPEDVVHQVDAAQQAAAAGAGADRQGGGTGPAQRPSE